MSFALTISGLSKTYPNGVRALSDVSLTIPAGMFGLLGPNGAGKSTLMRTLATLQDADSGTVTLRANVDSAPSGSRAAPGDDLPAELDVLRDKDAVRRILGYLPQDFGVYDNLTAIEFLRYFAALGVVALLGAGS